MSGASTVIGTVYAAALNKLPIEILAYVPAVENMISGGAYKPGDIISTASGKTIEVYPNMVERLKAAELLGRSEADFLTPNAFYIAPSYRLQRGLYGQ